MADQRSERILSQMNFEEIYTQFSPRIFRICMGYVNDSELARDLTQETFIAVWQNLPGFRHESSVSTWIFRIATNNCLRALERSRRVKTVELPFELPAPNETGAAREKEARRRFLYGCIAELAETDRIIISLFLEDVPQAEIAEVAGLSGANVRVRIHRIKEKLAGKFKEYGRPD